MELLRGRFHMTSLMFLPHKDFPWSSSGPKISASWETTQALQFLKKKKKEKRVKTCNRDEKIENGGVLRQAGCMAGRAKYARLCTKIRKLLKILHSHVIQCSKISDA